MKLIVFQATPKFSKVFRYLDIADFCVIKSTNVREPLMNFATCEHGQLAPSLDVTYTKHFLQ
jgi:hypothetical protein